ncbi:hypothetical protein ABZ820_12825 [Streptomyces diacarni]|uniref:hypothetical protein n=1 Tax=Streptomyces diacarni TaxID=2800381 RepID=UPI0033EEF55D
MDALDVLAPAVGLFWLWGPVAVVAGVAALCWSAWPPEGRDGEETPVRTVSDTDRPASLPPSLSCADTYPDVSADNRPDTSGPDDAGER